MRRTAPDDQRIPAFYQSPAKAPSLLFMLANAISDPAAIIPVDVYEARALKLPMPMGPVVVTHPDAVRTVLLDKGDTFGRPRPLRTLMRRAWGQGLAAAEGESWLRQRRAASPAFRPQAAEAAMPAIAQAARQVSGRWASGQRMELGAATGRMVNQVIMTTLLSADGVDLDELTADMPTLAREIATFGLIDAAPFPDNLIRRFRGFGRSPQEARVRAVAARLARLRAEPPDPVQDLPALLRGAGPLEENVLGFMLAGFETTGLGAAWALYLLALYPEWQEKVRAEARASGARARLEDLPIAHRVAQETLRLYPPAPILARAAARRTVLEGYRLWPGQGIIIPVYAIHRHRALWEAPDAFDPDRFASPAGYDRGAYLPFGLGPRVCIAAAFAVTEITVLVSELARSFHFEAVDPQPEISLRVATLSRTGLHVTANRLN